MPVASASDMLNEWADEEAGIEAVQRVLDCLDDIYALQDSNVDPEVLLEMLRDGRLHQFLQVGWHSFSKYNYICIILANIFRLCFQAVV